MKTTLLATIISLLFISVLNGQDAKIDSLETLLKRHTRVDTVKINLLNKLAYQVRLSDPKKAKSYAQEASGLSTRLNYRKGEAASLWVIGITTLYSDKQAALDNFQKALKIAEEIGDEPGQCNYLIAVGNLIKQWGDVSASNEAYKKALSIAQKLKDKKLILKVLINSARNETRSGNHIEAIKHLEEIVEVSKEIDYKEVLARAYADLGLIYGIRGDNPLSLQYHLQALEINEKRNDYIGVYDNYINIANIQSDQNDIDATLETLNKAQQLAAEKQDSMRISLCFSRLGDFYRQANRSEALYYYQKSLSMSRFNKLAHNINNLINIGSIYTDRDEYEKAMASFNEALILAQQADIKRVFGEVYAKIGILDLKQKKYGEAEGYIKKALALAKETSFTELQKNCSEQLSMIYAETGRFKDAYIHHKQYKLLYDSLYNERNTRQIALLESSYKFAKERDVYELEKSNREIRIRSQQQAIVLLAVISFLILMLSFVIHRSSRMRKRVLQLEIDSINQELEANQKAMAVAKLKLVQNSERDAHNIKILEDIEKGTIEKGDKDVNSLINSYKIQTHLSNWEEFETLFTKVNTSFWDKLNKLYPNLTPNERKLCVFLKLNMSSKDIALITFQSEEAIKKSRLRLRKKFNLDRSANLTAVIQSL